MSKILPALLLCAAAALAGCASGPPSTASAALFHDELFKPASAAVGAGAVFALSPEMQRYVDHEIAQQSRRLGRRQGLVDALYNKGQLQLEYDSALTRNAAQAFEARRGNCLSLVLMTAAFAKALDLPVRFQSVYVNEVWSRSDDLVFLTGHVNLALGRPLADTLHSYEAELLVIDFLPAEEMRTQRSRVIEERTVLSMYMNNRAAESLDQGELDEAYWWARGAIEQDPHFTAAVNTLGVIYRRAGRPLLAEQVFRVVLAQEPANTQTLSNLVLVLRDQGRLAEVEQTQARLRALQPNPPFKLFDEGVAAMHAGDFRRARELFQQELDRSAYFHEFHFWMALANYGLGDMAAVRKHLALARDNSPTVKDRQMYAAKLDSLRAAARAQQ